jgi:hypothetical protein
MKALTIKQPWATLIATGAKRVETRSWSSRYRGLLAVHAGAGFPKLGQRASLDSAFAIEIANDPLPLGAVIATCRLVSCIPTRGLQQNRVIAMDPETRCADFVMTDEERNFGDYAEGRWAWLLADVKPLPVPIPARGRLGLWNWELPTEAEAAESADAGFDCIDCGAHVFAVAGRAASCSPRCVICHVVAESKVEDRDALRAALRSGARRRKRERR